MIRERYGTRQKTFNKGFPNDPQTRPEGGKEGRKRAPADYPWGNDGRRHGRSSENAVIPGSAPRKTRWIRLLTSKPQRIDCSASAPLRDPCCPSWQFRTWGPADRRVRPHCRSQGRQDHCCARRLRERADTAGPSIPRFRPYRAHAPSRVHTKRQNCQLLGLEGATRGFRFERADEPDPLRSGDAQTSRGECGSVDCGTGSPDSSRRAEGGVGIGPDRRRMIPPRHNAQVHWARSISRAT
jgi:hypothetical protein